MELTVQIDAELLRALEERARHDDVALNEIVNEVLKQGLAAQPIQATSPVTPYRLRTYSMGQPLVPLDKALALAAELENEEILKKLAQGK